MQTYLIIDEQAKKYHLISAGDKAMATHSFQEIAELPATDDTIVTVLIAADNCTLYPLTLPKLKKNELIEAARYALEEYLPTDIDSLHFTYTPQDSSGAITIAIMEQALYTEKCQAYQAANINVHYMLPYYLVIPCQADTWSLVYDNELCVIRTGELGGYTIDTNNLATILSILLSKAEHPPKKLIVFNGSAQTINLPNDLDLAIEFNQQSIINHDTCDLITHSPLNLLTKQYKSKHKKPSKNKPWRLAIIALSCWLALLFLGKGAALGYLHWQSNKINQVVSTAYQRIYPGKQLTSSVVNTIRLDLKRLQISAKANQLFSTLSNVGQSLHNIHLDTIDYSKKILTIIVTANTDKELIAFKKSLSKRNLIVKQHKQAKVQDKIQATITIKDRQ